MEGRSHYSHLLTTEAFIERLWIGVYSAVMGEWIAATSSDHPGTNTLDYWNERAEKRADAAVAAYQRAHPVEGHPSR